MIYFLIKEALSKNGLEYWIVAVVFSGKDIIYGNTVGKNDRIKNMLDGQLYYDTETMQIFEWDQSLCSKTNPNISCWKFLSNIRPQEFKGGIVEVSCTSSNSGKLLLDLTRSQDSELVEAYECKDSSWIKLTKTTSNTKTKLRDGDKFVTDALIVGTALLNPSETWVYYAGLWSKTSNNIYSAKFVDKEPEVDKTIKPTECNDSSSSKGSGSLMKEIKSYINVSQLI